MLTVFALSTCLSYNAGQSSLAAKIPAASFNGANALNSSNIHGKIIYFKQIRHKSLSYCIYLISINLLMLINSSYLSCEENRPSFLCSLHCIKVAFKLISYSMSSPIGCSTLKGHSLALQIIILSLIPSHL